jgi:hypothetical protein
VNNLSYYTIDSFASLLMIQLLFSSGMYFTILYSRDGRNDFPITLLALKK